MIKQIDYSLYILLFIPYISFNHIYRECLRKLERKPRYIFQTIAAARAVMISSSMISEPRKRCSGFFILFIPDNYSYNRILYTYITI
jgi:hypothetical protein